MINNFLNINFEITHNCNQLCKYCYNYSLSGGPKQSGNPVNTITKLFQQVTPGHLTITGGEPLISPYLKECAMHAILNDAKTTIITNASTKDKEIFKYLINLGVSCFQITINSNVPSIHDSLAQKEGSWGRTISNIKSIRSWGGNVIPTIILTSKNVQNIESHLEMILNMGMNKIIVNRYNLSKGDYFSEMSLSGKGLNEVFSRIDHFARESGMLITSNVCTPYCILDPNNYQNINFGHCPDNPLHKPITIDFSGRVRLCNHSPFIMGNIFEKSLIDLLFSQASLGWVTSIPEHCMNCSQYDECKGGCRAASEQIKGSHLLADPLIDLLNDQAQTAL
jgi:radical SAM protein with 4Fe4S-binding SPASM domain